MARKLDREAITRAAIEHSRLKRPADQWTSLCDHLIESVVGAVCSGFEAAAAEPRCPRQHLSPAAEQRVLSEQGPCMCASCTACRERGMT